MKGVFAIYRRELAGLFFSPLAWVLLCLALAFNGYFFTFYVAGSSGDVGQSLALALGDGQPFWAMLLILPPLITMRMISEEARSGLLEFLLTAPVTDLAVVIGKLAAATTLMGLLWSSTMIYGGVIQSLGTAPDWPPVLSAVVGTTLVSALFCAIGLAASSFTNTPLVAAFLAFILNACVLALPFIDPLLKLPRGHWLKLALGHANILTQFHASFGTGVLDSKPILFLLAWTAFFVFVATRSLEARRWR